MRTSDEILEAVDGAEVFGGRYGARDYDAKPEPKPAVPPFAPIVMADWQGREPAPRRFIAADWLPAECATSLYGPGGIGKTLLAQQLGTSVATGRAWLGAAVEQGPVVAFLAEDDDDELVRRQIRINKALGVEMIDLGALHLQGRVGLETTLARYGSTGLVEVTPVVDAIHDAAKIYKPNLIILDPIALLFGGNENNRADVSHFINLVSGIAREHRCAVLLLGHPGKADGSEYSGSTAWNAAVRSRWLLQRDENEENGLVVSRVKSNYAAPDTMQLTWPSGVIRSRDPGAMSEGERREAERHSNEAKAAILSGLTQLRAQGRATSHSPSAKNYAPRTIVAAGLANGCTIRDLEAALTALFNDKRIRANGAVVKGGDRKWRTGIVLPEWVGPGE